MKKIRYYLFALASGMLLINSCKKDDEQLITTIRLSVTTDTIRISVSDSLVITASAINGTAAHNWVIDAAPYSSNSRLAYKFTASGLYKVDYKGVYTGGQYTKSFVVVVDPPVRPVTPSSSKYISHVFAYLPAPGQFINEANLGSPQAAEKIIGGLNGLISLGGFGGYVVFGFDHSVTNRSGNDFALYGNPLAPPLEWSEPGIVMVSQDNNGNGLPDDPWYELPGSEYNHTTTKKNYTITYYNPKAYANVAWKDNLGNTGAVEINNFHKHNYYPEFAANLDSISFTGTLIRNTFGLAPGTGIFVNLGFPFGYADNWSTDDDYATNRFNPFDINKAVDNAGNPVSLGIIDFIKVYTGQNDKGNTLLGEVSTEMRGAVDLSIP